MVSEFFCAKIFSQNLFQASISIGMDFFGKSTFFSRFQISQKYDTVREYKNRILDSVSCRVLPSAFDMLIVPGCMDLYFFFR